MSDSKLKCNVCWKPLEDKVGYLTQCSHIFCKHDAQKYLASNRDLICPVCDSPLSSRNSTMELDLQPGPSKVTALCGLPPKSILEISSRAIQFWEYQKSNELNYEMMKTRNVERKVKSFEQQCESKIVEMQNKMNTLNHKYESCSKELENEKREYAELQEKYAEKVRQKRKIEELYNQTKATDSGLGGPSKTTFVPESRSPSPFRPRDMMSPTGFTSPQPSRFTLGEVKSPLWKPRPVKEGGAVPSFPPTPLRSSDPNRHPAPNLSHPILSPLRSPSPSPQGRKLTRPPFFSTPVREQRSESQKPVRSPSVFSPE